MEQRPVKPWSTQRQILWLIGVLGVAVVALGLGMAFLLHGGFPHGKHGFHAPSPGLEEVLGGILFSVPFVYYIVVAHNIWSRKLWVVGLAIHVVILALALALLIPSSSRSFVWFLFFLPGGLTWVSHVRRGGDA